MKPLWPRQLDLAALDAHLKAEHPSEAGNLPRVRADRARVHAQAHAYPTTHDHLGEVVVVAWAPEIFGNGPMGRFTGRDMKVRQR